MFFFVAVEVKLGEGMAARFYFYEGLTIFCTEFDVLITFGCCLVDGAS